MPNLLLNNKKILGMNARNLIFIHSVNKKKAVNIANDKILCKEVLIKAGISTASLYATIKNRRELLEFNWESLPSSFVIKPVHGLGGQGIIIIFGRQKNNFYITNNDLFIDNGGLTDHVSNILDGNYSLSNIPDIAFIEERLKMHPDFKNISWQGIPDIRVIVYNNVPVMAMLRLTTKESKGKANLHQGGIGVGIDIATGITTYATQFDKPIIRHPDTGASLTNFVIPDWENILSLAIKTQQAVGLGYGGVDIVIDRDKGPMVLEINGHPGLSIQNANLCSLRDRLDRITGLEITTANNGIAMAKELFGNKQDNDDSKDKKILGFMETVSVITGADKETDMRAKIDSGIFSTTMNKQLAIKLGFGREIQNFSNLYPQDMISAVNIKETEAAMNAKNDPVKTGISSIVAVKHGADYILRPRVKLGLKIKKILIDTEVAVSRNEDISYPLVIGRRDLNNFLIDPTKTLTK